jgi:hypothetical protein
MTAFHFLNNQSKNLLKRMLLNSLKADSKNRSNLLIDFFSLNSRYFLYTSIHILVKRFFVALDFGTLTVIPP